MFEQNQDTGLLYHSLVSAVNTYSKNSCSSKAINDALSIITQSVKNIIRHNLEGIKDEKKRIKTEVHTHARLHAAVFYTLLKSYNMTSKSAYSYYSSIHNWPMMDIEFYIQLNYQNHWSEYFIKSVSQMPSSVVLKLLTGIYNIPFPKPIKFYSWHLIYQAATLKLLEVPYDNEAECKFNFCFKTESPQALKKATNVALTMNNNQDYVADHIEFDTICDLFKYMNSELCDSYEPEMGVIKIIFHNIKTLLKFYSIAVVNDMSHEIIETLVFLNQVLQDVRLIELLKEEMNFYTVPFASHDYANASWDISLSYLTLIISSYRSTFGNISNIKENLVKLVESAAFFLKNIPFEEISPFKEENPFEEDFFKLDHHMELLLKIIQHNLESASYAAQILLLNTSSLTKNRVLQALEENHCVIDFEKSYPTMIICINEIETEDLKVRLLKLFYKMLSESPIKLYNDVYEKIVSSFGFSDIFKLPDFDDQLSLFARKTLTVEEAEVILPLLLVQSPIVTLKSIIDQVLIQGSDSEALIHALKLVPKVLQLTYNTNNKIPYLIEILKERLETVKLESYESKNMVILFELLMKAHLEKYILSPNLLIETCILPNLTSPADTRSNFILECLHVSLSILIPNNKFIISAENLRTLIVFLAQIIQNCIECGNGKRKELPISVLYKLECHQKVSGILDDIEKIKLHNKVTNDFSEMVQVYLLEFLSQFGGVIEPSAIWTWSCKNKDSSIFKNSVSDNDLTYMELLNILLQVLPNFTKSEWLYSYALVKECCKNSTLTGNIIQSSDKSFLSSDSNEVNLFAVISCFITSVTIILQENVFESLYIGSCFCNTLMNALNQEAVTLQLLLTIFHELCFVLKCISPELISVFTSVLLEIKNSLLLSCTHEDSKIDCRNLLSEAVNSIPESSEKNALYQKINSQ